MIVLLWLAAAAGTAYQLIALAAVLRQLLRRDPDPSATPPISVMKPVRGMDGQFRHAIDSHQAQDYPEYELLVGSAAAEDPALEEARRKHLRVVVSRTDTPNGKAGVLADLAASARYATLVVNDADIAVPRNYLRVLAAWLEQPGVGVVTSLYRANAQDAAGRWESLGIATDFAPSVLVAPLFGINEFAMGSTMAFRAADLRRIGGFEAIGAYIADDYQLGKRLCALGYRVALTRLVVETEVGGGSWSDVWRHQVRWARTIRLSRGAYIGLPITNAVLWSALLWAFGYAGWAAGLLALRYGTGLMSGLVLLRCQITARFWPLMALRDLWGLAVWMAGMFGNTVEWRGLRLSLDSDGRIIER